MSSQVGLVPRLVLHTYRKSYLSIAGAILTLQWHISISKSAGNACMSSSALLLDQTVTRLCIGATPVLSEYLCVVFR